MPMNARQVSIFCALLMGLSGQGHAQAPPKSVWDSHDEIMEWISWTDTTPVGSVTGLDRLTESSRSFVRIRWKALNVPVALGKPAYLETRAGVNPDLLPTLLDPRVHNAVKLVLRQTMGFDSVNAGWLHRGYDPGTELEDMPRVFEEPLASDGDWHEVLLKLNDSPKFRPDADIVFFGWTVVPSDSPSLADLGSRYQAMEPAAYLDIDRIEFLTVPVVSGGLAITDFEPKRGQRATQVTIHGHGFALPARRNDVYFGGFRAEVISGNESTLVVRADGYGDLVPSVVVGSRRATAAEPFAFLGSPRQLRIVSGDHQAAAVGSALSPMVVRITDDGGHGLPGYKVSFVIKSGGGTLSTKEATTDAEGMASTVLTLGPTAGTVLVEARYPWGGPILLFTATAE